MLIISLIFLAGLTILMSTLLGRTAGFIRFGGNSVRSEQATAIAEAGVEYALWQLNETAGAYAPPAGGELVTLPPTGTTTGQVVIKFLTGGTSQLKKIEATGYIPDLNNPRAKRTIKTDAIVSSSQIAFNYAIQVGTGGVVMENSAIINGTVYSNASDAQTSPNKSIQGSGSSQINGEAWTVGTVSTPNPVLNCASPPCKHELQPPSTMPTIDYNDWKTQANGGDLPADCNPGKCTVCPAGTCQYDSGVTNLGPQKLVGNLLVQNTAQIVVNGPIYVTGNVDVKNTASIKLNDSFGSNGTVLITDGLIVTQNSGQFIPTNANPKGYILAITTSTNALAVNIKNSGVNAIFYALDGGATLENTAQVTSLVANKILIKNNAVLNYDQGLASAQFSSGPGGSWQVKKGTYRFSQ